MKDFDPNAHVRILKVPIRTNGEIEDAKFVNMFSFTLGDIMSNSCNNYMGDYPNCIFVKL